MTSPVTATRALASFVSEMVKVSSGKLACVRTSFHLFNNCCSFVNRKHALFSNLHPMDSTQVAASKAAQWSISTGVPVVISKQAVPVSSTIHLSKGQVAIAVSNEAHVASTGVD
jgi:hypothetical protein